LPFTLLTAVLAILTGIDGFVVAQPLLDLLRVKDASVRGSRLASPRTASAQRGHSR